MNRIESAGLGLLGDSNEDDDDLEDLHSHLSIQSSSVSTGAASGATPLTPAHWGGSGNGSGGAASRASPSTGQHQQPATTQLRPSDSSSPPLGTTPGPPTTPSQEGPGSGLISPSPFAAAAAISTMAVAVAVAALNSADRERERERERIERELFEREGYAARSSTTPVKVSRHNSDGSLMLTPREKRAYSSPSPALRSSSDRSSSSNNSQGSSSVRSGNRGRGVGVRGGISGGSLLSDLVKAADNNGHNDEDDDDSEEENVTIGSGKTKAVIATIPTTAGSHPSFFIPSPNVAININDNRNRNDSKVVVTSNEPRRSNNNDNNNDNNDNHQDDDDNNNQQPSFTVTRVVPMEQVEHDADGRPGAPSTPLDNIPPPTPGSGARPPLTFSPEPTVMVSASMSTTFEPVARTSSSPPTTAATTLPPPAATTVVAGDEGPATMARDVEITDVPTSSSRDVPPSSSSSPSSPVLTTTLSQPANAGDQRVQVVTHEGCQSGMVVRITTGNGDGDGE